MTLPSCAYCDHARELHTEILGCEAETPGSTAIMDCDCLDYVEASEEGHGSGCICADHVPDEDAPFIQAALDAERP